MNEFERFLALSLAEKRDLGTEHTPAEIAQQPEMWLAAWDMLEGLKTSLSRFMKQAGLTGFRRSTVILSGAGSSEYIANAVANVLRTRLRREVISVPSTDFITHPRSILIPGKRYVVLSFARSGDSPESIAMYNLVRQLEEKAYQIIITCNKDGSLIKAAASDKRSLCILLPEETNDKSLVMTSSFSTMAFTILGLCYLDNLQELKSTAAKLKNGAERIIREYADAIKEFVTKPVSRVQFLGTGCLYGTMEECRLKTLEMTEGRIAANVNSYLGVRHGPQVFINDECLVVAGLSSDPYTRQYEIDLLAELRKKGQGAGTMVICDRATGETHKVADLCIELFPGGESVPDEFRIITDVVAGQILGMFKSLDLGLKPDNPSISGTITRVVEGVTIYPFQTKGDLSIG